MTFKPMLAHEYKKHRKKIEYPCYVQPKLDGIRCIAVVDPAENGGVFVRLESRNGNDISSLPQLQLLLELALAKYCHRYSERVYLDGELTANVPFEKLCSLVKRDKDLSDPEFVNAEFKYVLFDVYSETTKNGNYEDRLDWLVANVECCHAVDVIKTYSCYNEQDVTEWYRFFERNEYEGMMIRDFKSPYEQKRSFSLLKRKPVKEGWYKIVDMIEGKGKLSGCLGAFVCVTPEGKRFKVKPAWTEEKLREAWNDDQRCNYFECDLKVQYQELTGKNGVPKFPIGTKFDWSEDGVPVGGKK